MCVCWMAAGKPGPTRDCLLSEERHQKVKAEPDFGVKIPAQPQLMLDMEQARGLLHRRGCIAGEHLFVARIYRYDQRLQLY